MKWIEYENFKFYTRHIINENNEKFEDKDIDNLIKYITEENEDLNLTEVNGAENNKDNDELNSENSINEIDIEQIDNSKERLSEDDKNEESEDINIINNNNLDINNLINILDELNINKEDGKDDWFNRPLNERVNLRVKNKVKNNKKSKKFYNYPKNSD